MQWANPLELHGQLWPGLLWSVATAAVLLSSMEEKARALLEKAWLTCTGKPWRIRLKFLLCREVICSNRTSCSKWTECLRGQFAEGIFSTNRSFFDEFLREKEYVNSERERACYVRLALVPEVVCWGSVVELCEVKQIAIWSQGGEMGRGGKEQTIKSELGGKPASKNKHWRSIPGTSWYCRPASSTTSTVTSGCRVSRLTASQLLLCKDINNDDGPKQYFFLLLLFFFFK